MYLRYYRFENKAGYTDNTRYIKNKQWSVSIYENGYSYGYVGISEEERGHIVWDTDNAGKILFLVK